MTHIFKKVGVAFAICALVVLAGCTSTVSRNLADDGRSAELVFPDIQGSAWMEEGTFPNLDNLRNIAPGMSKDQLYDLIGRPHFKEGLARVREWDYVFNFRTPTGVKVCQYKALYDTELVAQSFHWKPADCANLLKPAAPMERVVERTVETPVERPVPPQRAAPRRVELSADALFAFGRSDLSDLLPKGRRELDELVASLRDVRDVMRMRVIGHTDRLGSDASNERLALARATTVRDHFVRAGVPARVIEVDSRGEREPKVQCQDKNREALIACLAPNRRVEIEIAGER